MMKGGGGAGGGMVWCGESAVESERDGGMGSNGGGEVEGGGRKGE